MCQNVIGKALSTQELEFFAENESVEIVPTFDSRQLTDDGHLHFIADKYGPFEPQVSTIVPLWLAINMKHKNLCTIKPPYWMELETLKGRINAEKLSDQFQEGLPMYYVEIGNMILIEAQEGFGADLQKVKNAFLELAMTRINKIKQQISNILTTTDGLVRTLPMKNLTHCELNTIREYYLGTLDMQTRLDMLEKKAIVPGSYTSGRETNTQFNSLRRVAGGI
eukprot:TRINITY_DN10172_c0_g2_i1.p1 TRINITY_DN10172_c0_g2~~TRINITY_DN10172_c0_g2_i1.p1  ORF type:complete len:233 (-),score=22.39 TRINITY_DN10172_c0_g2_i1:190-858(-)